MRKSGLLFAVLLSAGCAGEADPVESAPATTEAPATSATPTTAAPPATTAVTTTVPPTTTFATATHSTTTTEAVTDDPSFPGCTDIERRAPAFEEGIANHELWIGRLVDNQIAEQQLLGSGWSVGDGMMIDGVAHVWAMNARDHVLHHATFTDGQFTDLGPISVDGEVFQGFIDPDVFRLADGGIGLAAVNGMRIEGTPRDPGPICLMRSENGQDFQTVQVLIDESGVQDPAVLVGDEWVVAVKVFGEETVRVMVGTPESGFEATVSGRGGDPDLFVEPDGTIRLTVCGEAMLDTYRSPDGRSWEASDPIRSQTCGPASITGSDLMLHLPKPGQGGALTAEPEPAATAPATSTTSSPSTPTQGSNPFASGSMELRDCIVSSLGEDTFNELAAGRMPAGSEMMAVGMCMAQATPGAGGPTGSGGPPTVSCTPAEPGGYSRHDRPFMFGIKAFHMYPPGEQSVADEDDIKALGMNTVGLVLQIPYDDDGHINYPYSTFGSSFSDLDSSLCHIGNLINRVKSAGLSVYLSGEPLYYRMGPGPEPGVLDSASVPTYLSELPEVMTRLAETAERYKVEWLAPIGEPDKYFGPDAANQIMQDVLPSFDGFNGKLVWQVYDSVKRLDLRGYDVAGLAVLGCDWDGVGGMFDTTISRVVDWAAADGVGEIAHVEFGCVNNAREPSAAIANFDRWLGATSAFSTGLIVLDNPRSAPNGQSVVGTWLEDWVVEAGRAMGFSPG